MSECYFIQDTNACHVCQWKASNPGAYGEGSASKNKVTAATMDATAQKINTSQHGAEETNAQPLSASRRPAGRLTSLSCRVLVTVNRL